MDSGNKHLAREFRTISKMVGIYCSDHHGGSGRALCGECSDFLDYAKRRLEKCPYGDDKPTCANCPIHCYKPAKRELVQEIMRYAGPRMMLRHPVLAIAHLIDGKRAARHPKELTREDRLHSRKE